MDKVNCYQNTEWCVRSTKVYSEIFDKQYKLLSSNTPKLSLKPNLQTAHDPHVSASYFSK